MIAPSITEAAIAYGPALAAAKARRRADQARVDITKLLARRAAERIAAEHLRNAPF